MKFCCVCGSEGAVKCTRCNNAVCARHAKQVEGQVVCPRCARLAQEDTKQ